jgi:flagellar hook-associated protein 1 FlgK
LSNTNSFHFRGFEWKFDGFAAKDDLFTLTTNGNRADDASNILRFTKLSTKSDETGRGGYAQIYSDLVTDTGFRSREAEQRLETNEAIHEVALDRKSEFSGVDLDAEAARLIEQQQAYQAMARVLSTAKELVDTILRSI